eukprot:4229429-Pyramimonas_sp.AAC.2
MGPETERRLPKAFSAPPPSPNLSELERRARASPGGASSRAEALVKCIFSVALLQSEYCNARSADAFSETCGNSFSARNWGE